MLLGPKVPLDVAPAGPHVRIDDRVLDGSRRAPHLVDRASHRPGGLSRGRPVRRPHHPLSRPPQGTLVRSGVTVSVGRDEPRCTAPRTRVDRGGEFAQASVASSSSADACATCSFSFSPRPFSLLPLTLFVRPGERCWGGKSDCVGMALCPCPSRAWGVLPPALLGTPVRSRGHALDRSFVRWMPECVPLGGLPDSDDSREEHDSKTRRRDGMDRA